MTDVTGKEQACGELRESEAFHRLLTESVSDFIRLHDLSGHSVYASHSVARLYARTPKEMFESAATSEDEGAGSRRFHSSMYFGSCNASPPKSSAG